MQIRRLKKEEVEEGILFATRKKSDDLMQILGKCLRDKLFYWGCYEAEQLCGVIAVTNQGFITTFYVSPGKSKQWIQKQLLEYAGHTLKDMCSVEKLSATVIKADVAGYQELGFLAVETEQAIMEAGEPVVALSYTPAPTLVTESNIDRPVNKKRVAVVAGVLLLVLAVIVGIVWYYETRGNTGIGGLIPKIETGEPEEDTPTQKAEVSGIGDEEYQPENIEDITKVEPYIGTDVTYGVKTEQYEVKEETEAGNLDFQVQYPVLENLSGDKAADINNLIKNTALSTVNLLYLNPTDATKALWEDETKPYLYSHVKYQITYMNNNIMSIAFEDHYYMGDTSSEYLDLRTLNINLKDGTQYQLKDVANLNQTFVNSWYYRMCKKAPESWVLPELASEDYSEILAGNDIDGRYWDEYFLDANGAEVGFTYHHQGEKGIARGWLTVQYTYGEMQTYKTDSDFWNYVTVE